MKQAVVLMAGLCLATTIVSGQATLTGELKKWHKITLTFQGPNTNEGATPNPFLDYKLDVTFTNGSSQYTVPGYYAADGNAGESSATEGDRWRVHFAPDEVGTWNWQASFRQGANVAVSEDPAAGSSTAFDGLSGSFEVRPSDKSGNDLRAKGRLVYTGERYLSFSEEGTYFLKFGTSSPENLLAYNDFDNTPNNGARRKSWGAHLQDWNDSDPSWKGAKGKGIIGALNYLSEQGQNAISFLTLTLNGDDDNVFPFLSEDAGNFSRMDCSKLDQWEIVFEHADQLGLLLHVKIQERENDQLLDGGDLGTQRKLYYRELIARFSHHLAVTWDMGEENSNTSCQQEEFAQYFNDIDPYQHPVIIHAQPDEENLAFQPLLGGGTRYAGASLQIEWDNVHQHTLGLIQDAASSGKEWVISNDEQGPSHIGVPDDAETNTRQTQANIRKRVLWGNLMAGGAGVEYYFGYYLQHSDLTCQDFRTRSRMWRYNRIARTFMEDNIPYWTMDNHNELVDNPTGNGVNYCLADPGYFYLVYLGSGGNREVDLENFNKPFTVQWFNPREGGDLINGNTIQGRGKQALGNPPDDTQADWVAIVVAEDFVFDPQTLRLVNPGEQQNTGGESINFQLAVRGGSEPFTFSIQGLPDGLTLNTSDGTISGTLAALPDPEEPLEYQVKAWVVDNSNPPQADTIDFSWFIQPEQVCLPAGTPCNDLNPNTINDQEDGNCNCVGEPSLTLDQVEIWKEVECGEIGDNWRVVDTDAAASNNSYVTPIKTIASLNLPPDDPADLIRLEIEAPLAGEYRLYARTMTSSGKGDSFWFRLNGGQWIKWNFINKDRHGPEFQWDVSYGEVLDEFTTLERFELEEGVNVMELTWREPGIRLDKLFFSGKSLTPDGKGPELLFCGEVAEDTLTVNVDFNVYPNPANDQFFVEGERSGQDNISIAADAKLFDGLGRLVGQQTVPLQSSFKFRWDVYGLAPGMYVFDLAGIRKRIIIHR